MKQKKATGIVVSLDIRSLVIMTCLAALSAIIIFYLGVIFGKADRDPNIDLCADKVVIEENKAYPNVSIKDLEIYKIHDKRNKTKKVKKAEKPVVVKKIRKTTKPENTDFFTVQVFSSGNQKKAEKFITDLKAEGFNAYLSEFSVHGKQLYRVRVGKVSKSKSLALKSKLKKSQTLKNTEMEFRIFRSQ